MLANNDDTTLTNSRPQQDPSGIHISDLVAQRVKKAKKARKEAAKKVRQPPAEKPSNGDSGVKAQAESPPKVIYLRDVACFDLALNQSPSEPERKISPLRRILRWCSLSSSKSAESSVPAYRGPAPPAPSERRKRIITQLRPQEKPRGLSRDYTQAVKQIGKGRPLSLPSDTVSCSTK